MRILLIEDDPRVSGYVQEELEGAGHRTDVVPCGADGLRSGQSGSYDVIVLDVGLPDMSGYDVASQLRAAGDTTPILMLTARDTEDDIVRGFEVGADDYLTKPFSVPELKARLRALVRRDHEFRSHALRVADVVMHRVTRTARRGGSKLKLTPKEFRLLEALMIQGGAVVSRGELLRSVLGVAFETHTNLLDVHMSRLRQKLEAGGRPRIIRNVPGVGFVISEADEAPAPGDMERG